MVCRTPGATLSEPEEASPLPIGQSPCEGEAESILGLVAEHLKKGRGRRAEDWLQGSSRPLGLVVEG